MSKPRAGIKVLYHATHQKNLKSIIATGLNPELATGDLMAVWLCERKVRDWAVEHVAERHSWVPAECVLVRVHIRPVRVHRTRWEHVFYCPTLIHPTLLFLEDRLGVWQPAGMRFTRRRGV